MRGPFSQAFFAGDSRATSFLAREYADPVARLAHVNRASSREVSPAVLSALIVQNADFAPSSQRAKNLADLGAAGTTAMVTGQQVGLFLGPLYSFHKAAAAIADARAIERETGKRCVPIFWLQSEDHDFDEINECVVVDRDGELVTLSLDDGPDAASKISVKHVVLGQSVAALCQRLADAVGEGPFLEVIRRHYRPGSGLVKAFAGLMAEVFAAEGLILLDPRTPEMAAAFAPIHERAIRGAKPIAEALTRRSQALEAAGFDVQVHIRPGSALSFFHADGPEHARARFDDDRANEVLHRLLESPLSVSSSALLRPILQDSVLPTVGYVGGPGELNYFAQLSSLYEAFGLEMPMFVPRARFRIIDPRTKARMESHSESSLGTVDPAKIESAIVEASNRVSSRCPEMLSSGKPCVAPAAPSRERLRDSQPDTPDCWRHETPWQLNERRGSQPCFHHEENLKSACSACQHLPAKRASTP